MIETLADWNERMECLGCCQMPYCPAPFLIIEKQNPSIGERGFHVEYPPGTPFVLSNWGMHRVLRFETTLTKLPDENDGTFKTEYFGSGLITWERSFPDVLYAVVCGELIGGATATSNYGGSSSFSFEFSRLISGTWVILNTGFRTITHPLPSTSSTYQREDNDGTDNVPYTVAKGGASFATAEDEEVFEDTKLWDEWLELALETAILQESEDCWFSGSQLKSAYTLTEPTSYSGGANVNKLFTRFRFRVPISHLGTHYRILYDLAEFPEDDGEPSLVDSDLEIVWTGPGDQSSQSHPSWLSPWSDVIQPPTVPGEIRVVNIRYFCLSENSRYGTKPQITGEAYPEEEL